MCALEANLRQLAILIIHSCKKIIVIVTMQLNYHPYVDRQEKMNKICQNFIYILTYNFCSCIMQLHIQLIVGWTHHLVAHVVVYTYNCMDT
jgi:hypothetical protein